MLGDHLSRAGFGLTTVELDQGEPIPDLDRFDALVVMGGPMDVWHDDEHPWLVTEKAAIRHWVSELARPYLGVCLGHQLLAAALGGVVCPMLHPEIGVMDVGLTAAGEHDPLLSALPPNFPALQWHGAEVARLPVGTVALATNAHCAVQAMRVGPAAWGLQFHIEASAPVVAEWATVPEYRAALAATGDGDPTWMHRAVVAEQERMELACAALGRRLVDIVADPAVVAVAR